MPMGQVWEMQTLTVWFSDNPVQFVKNLTAEFKANGRRIPTDPNQNMYTSRTEKEQNSISYEWHLSDRWLD